MLCIPLDSRINVEFVCRKRRKQGTLMAFIGCWRLIGLRTLYRWVPEKSRIVSITDEDDSMVIPRLEVVIICESSGYYYWVGFIILLPFCKNRW